MLHRDIIPLFPLQKVLFPRMILPLHIFEERYKEMIAHCREFNRPFGVLLADEVERGAVGTTATIQRVLHEYEDGRMDIIAVGEERFKVTDVIYEQSYIKAEIKPLVDVNTLAASAREVEGMLDLFRGFIDRLGLEEKQREQLEELVIDLELEREVSYVIGQTIGLDNESQRSLLQQRSPKERIKLLLHELKRYDLLHERARQLFENSDFDPSAN
ncbi:LON peptidase substrate-binding domain-containing protein [bacterium]|nr:LON peptidase substrate-binding domain-containing protein [bacterium]